MKIGLVLPGFSADEHDWGIPALYNFVRVLAAENEIHVFALEYPYRRDRYDFFGATVHSMNGRHRGKLYAPRLWIDTLAAIFSDHRRARFDLIQAFWANEAGLVAMIAAQALGVPMIASVAGGELVGLRHIGYGGQLNRVERTIVNWVLKRADCVTVGSLYLQKIAARWRRDAIIAPLGVDTKMFDRHVASLEGASHVNIVNAASLVPVKQQEILLDAFAHLESHFRLEIAGAGERENFLRARAGELGISGRVKFAGAIAHDALPQNYRTADVFAQASLHEAQGMAALEAAACGLAISGTPVGILPEFAERGAAIAADGFDADALASALERAIESRSELGCRAREIAEKDFSLERTCILWRDLYNAVDQHNH